MSIFPKIFTQKFNIFVYFPRCFRHAKTIFAEIRIVESRKENVHESKSLANVLLVQGQELGENFFLQLICDCSWPYSDSFPSSKLRYSIYQSSRDATNSRDVSNSSIASATTRSSAIAERPAAAGIQHRDSRSTKKCFKNSLSSIELINPCINHSSRGGSRKDDGSNIKGTTAKRVVEQRRSQHQQGHHQKSWNGS